MKFEHITEIMPNFLDENQNQKRKERYLTAKKMVEKLMSANNDEFIGLIKGMLENDIYKERVRQIIYKSVMDAYYTVV